MCVLIIVIYRSTQNEMLRQTSQPMHAPDSLATPKQELHTSNSFTVHFEEEAPTDLKEAAPTDLKEEAAPTDLKEEAAPTDLKEEEAPY